MIVTAWARKMLAVRREHRNLTRAGYRRHETDWEIHRGHKIGWIIEDAKISADGMYVYTKLKDAVPPKDTGET